MKLDIGCGPNKKEGFIGVDQYSFPNVDVVTDLTAKWPWENSTIEEIHCSHTLEHFTADQRMHVLNEMYRVLKPGGKATIITPHWASHRAYGDPTHQWPPVSEMAYCYWNKGWRDGNAPHTDISNLKNGFNCDFDWTCASSYNVGQFVGRNQEYVNFALTNYKDAAMDLIGTITSRKTEKPNETQSTAS